ncbi:sigma-70 family RNA polymerase sigma factor [bacterium]|nr:sigma-70 family RNA polymerase sigma factor [bacterium]
MQTNPQPDFEQLLSEEVYQAAWGFCCRLSRSREDAQDLLQEGLLRAWRSLSQLREPCLFKPWLFTLLRRLHLSRSRRAQLPLAESWLFRQSAGLERDQFSQRLAEAMGRLPQAQRELLSLAYLDGLSLEELGALLRISPQSASQRLYRAREALRRSYARLGGPEPVPEVN